MPAINYNTRIRLKYDTYANWTSANPVLLDGELAIAAIASGNTQIVNSITAPQILIKVGDGKSNYNDLPFVSGLAADVYSWAKAENKPTYAASEITGIGDYIANYVDETLGISVDTNTVYKAEATADGRGFTLYSQNKGEAAWAEVTTISFSDVFVKSIATGSANGTISVDGVDVPVKGLGSAAFVDTTAFDAAGSAAAAQTAAEKHADDLNTEMDARVDALEAKFADGEGSVADMIADAVAAEAQLREDADKAINDKIGTVPADKTVVQMISEAQTAATYDDTEVRGLIADNKEALDVLNGSGNGSVKKTVDDAINKFATDITDDAVVNSYKELIDWVATHGSDAADMAAEIAALQAILEGIGDVEAGEKATVKAYVDDAIAALKIGDYATVAALNAAVERIAANETAIKTINETTIPAAQAAAEKHADELNTAMDDRVKVLEAIDHNGLISDALATAAADATDKANAAQTAAETTAANALATAKSDLEAEIAKKVDAVEDSRLMTDEEGTKLAGIEDGAQVNKIESIKVNGVALPIADDKSVDISHNIADLEQDEGTYVVFNCGSATTNI